MEKSYNSVLVLLSVVVAIAGAYVAIEMAQRVRETASRRRLFWVGGGSVAMGLGIWSMHFVAMLALDMGETVSYDGSVTLLSMVAAVSGCAIAFAIFDRAAIRTGIVAAASVFMGIAIAGMHYTGMAAMRMSAELHYDSTLVTASVIVAIVVSYVALILTRRIIISNASLRRRVGLTSGASVLMGLAVVAMHYTGMAAASFTPGHGSLTDGGLLLGDRNLGILVAVTSLALLIIAFSATQFERWRVQAAARWKSIIEISPQIVWSANAAGKIIDANQYWYDYTGLPPGAAVGDAWAATIHPEDRDRVIATWIECIAKGENLESEFRIRRADGEYHSFINKGRPIRNERGEIIRWIGIGVDIEERKIAELELQKTATELEAQTEELQVTTEELMQQTEEAQAANRAKSDFLASMSHELRTPLNAIGGYADLLELGLRGPLTLEQRDDLARIKRSQQHLLRLINDVLNFAKIDSGQLDYRIARVPINEAVRDTEAMIGPQIREKGIVYSFVGCDDSVAACADRDKVQQILINILGNAVKFTEPHGRITLSCESTAETVFLKVADTGIGIPPEKQRTIFDPFVQVHQRLSQMNQGVGLGLSISRDLARAMGGELSVESELGKGSKFTLKLPRDLDS